MQSDERVHRTSPVVIAIAWLIVAIPAAWGVSQTVLKSVDLFRGPPPGPTTTTSASVVR
ncbi:MAG TPA: hypothetical protein VL282_00560 [Tepidisphaeraceae bacterium]|jgi:hypothetical protein|nr:hypothetical protein [Tepidisphaeraceae bacterium]